MQILALQKFQQLKETLKKTEDSNLGPTDMSSVYIKNTSLTCLNTEKMLLIQIYYLAIM